MKGSVLSIAFIGITYTSWIFMALTVLSGINNPISTMPAFLNPVLQVLPHFLINRFAEYVVLGGYSLDSGLARDVLGKFTALNFAMLVGTGAVLKWGAR